MNAHDSTKPVSAARRIPPQTWLLAYGAGLLAVMVMDGVWLGFVARDFYARELDPLMADAVQWLPAALFYLGYPAGVIALSAERHAAGVGASAARGALIGLLAYGTYDLTNWSTLRGFGMQLALADMAWGCCISAACAAAAAAVVRRRSAG